MTKAPPHRVNGRGHGQPNQEVDMAKGNCSVDGCDRPHKGHGYCELHLRRVRKYGEPGEMASRRPPLPPECTVSGCNNKPIAKGLCVKHYQRNQTHGSPTGGAPERSRAPIAERFWSWVDVGEPDQCWPSRGCLRGASGHVNFQANGKGNYAHRVAWELTHGPVPDGLHVLHHCDNPPCCNPAHLFLGTHADNMADMAAKGRYRVIPQPGERNPQAKLTEPEVVTIRRRYAAGGISQAALAREYGVSPALVGMIVRRQIWTQSP